MDSEGSTVAQAADLSVGSDRPLLRRVARSTMTLAERRLLLILVDLLLINASLALAASIWSYFEFTSSYLQFTAKWFITLSVLWLVLGSALGIYNLARAGSITSGLYSSVTAALVISLVYRAIPWLTPPAEPRMLSFGFVGFAVASIALWRAAYALLLMRLAFERRALVIGGDATTHRLASELGAAADDERANPFRGSGYRVIGVLDDLPLADDGALDPTHSFLRLIAERQVDEILVSESNHLSQPMQEALVDCRELGIQVTPIGLVYERLAARLPVEYAQRDVGLIVSRGDSPSEHLYLFARRVMDIALAILGLGLMVPLVPPVALANALWSPGPLFYRQQRVGRSGRSFVMYKFRTMSTGAEDGMGAVWATEGDPRATPLGRWLRRTRLDELPQCLNVLRGEMSIVGPRPERPELVGHISRSLPIYRARHAVRPGITGWAQIHYRYGSSVEDARVKLEYDLYYVKHAGFALDLMILLQTPLVMLRGGGC